MMRGPGSRDLRLTRGVTVPRYPLASKYPGYLYPDRSAYPEPECRVLGGNVKKSNFKLKLEQKWHRDCAVRTRT
jgi:hypothetical protein